MTLEDKIGDQVLLISQNLGQVDKYFRALGNEYVEVINRGRETFLGCFRKPKLFEHVTWYELPNAMGNGRGPSGSFPLELDGLADCYDSSAGQGVEGLLNDRGESQDKPVGLPWWSAGVLVVLILWLVMQLPGLAGKALQKVTQTVVSVGTSTNLQSVAVRAVVGTNSPLVQPMLQAADPVPKSAIVAPRPSVVVGSSAGSVPEPLWITGVYGHRDSPVFLLSDGSEIRCPDPRVSAYSLGRSIWLELDGVRVWQ